MAPVNNEVNLQFDSSEPIRYSHHSSQDLLFVRLSKYFLTEKSDVRDLIRECYSSERGLYVCNVCGIERNAARSMQQHAMWHQRFVEKHANIPECILITIY